jgi:hypothetical protein
VTSDQLTAVLAKRVMSWRVGPERFLKGNRRWMPRWQFQPFRRMDHALQLLAKAGARYSITKAADGTVTADVTLKNRAGTATAKSEAAAMTVALACALGIDVKDSQ